MSRYIAPMIHQHEQLDRIFYALSDNTRRAVLAQLSEQPKSVSALSEPFEMALPSFLQHLKVLEDCGLAKSEKQGRVRTYRLTPEPLVAAEDWLNEKRKIWNKRLDQLDHYLLQMKENHNA